MKRILFLFLLSSLIMSCAVRPKGQFAQDKTSKAPDYTQEKYWAALPDRQDAADLLPTSDLEDVQAMATIDVFYIYPTIYTGEKGQNQWNAPVDDRKFLDLVDSTALKNQATIFNGVGRVFAPYYRQAHIKSYGALNIPYRSKSAKSAFELAYQDVEKAFDYYIEHYNQGRPFIIAAHSQGTTHAKRLIQEKIDKTNLHRRLVVAYLVGMKIEKGIFKNIPVCETPEQTTCFCAWRTYREGRKPKGSFKNGDDKLAVTNPLTWTTDKNYIEMKNHKGAIFYNFHAGFYDKIVGGQIKDGLFFINKPKFPGSIFFVRSNYHIGDYNLFWLDVRENAKYRERLFWK